MADMQETGGVEAQASEQVPESNMQESVTQDVTNDSAETVEQSVNQDEGEPEFVEGEDGKKYVPYEAFKARIDKLTAQKHESGEAHSLLEAIKNDPAVRKEFMESLQSGEESAASSKETDGPTPFEEFLAPLPPEHQAHYRNMGKAMASEFESYVENRIQQVLGEHIKPIMSHIGAEKLRNFSQSNKDFNKYQGKVKEIMESGRAKSIEDAYILASHEDKLKAVKTVGAKEEQERRQKMSRNSFSGKNIGGSSVKGKADLKSALSKAALEHGYTE